MQAHSPTGSLAIAFPQAQSKLCSEWFFASGTCDPGHEEFLVCYVHGVGAKKERFHLIGERQIIHAGHWCFRFRHGRRPLTKGKYRVTVLDGASDPPEYRSATFAIDPKIKPITGSPTIISPTGGTVSSPIYLGGTTTCATVSGTITGSGGASVAGVNIYGPDTNGSFGINFTVNDNPRLNPYTISVTDNTGTTQVIVTISP